MTGPVLDVAVRVGVVGAVAAGVVAGRAGLATWRDWRRRRAIAGAPLPGLAGGQTTVLLFTGSLCTDCVRQREILQDVGRQVGGWRVHEVQAAREQPLAARFGVESVPATVLLDREGHSVAVNYGLAGADVLLGQLRPLVAA
jgi:thiol-disulfide isomerase/thioredoxin